LPECGTDVIMFCCCLEILVGVQAQPAFYESQRLRRPNAAIDLWNFHATSHQARAAGLLQSDQKANGDGSDSAENAGCSSCRLPHVPIYSFVDRIVSLPHVPIYSFVDRIVSLHMYTGFISDCFLICGNRSYIIFYLTQAFGSDTRSITQGKSKERKGIKVLKHNASLVGVGWYSHPTLKRNKHRSQAQTASTFGHRHTKSLDSDEKWRPVKNIRQVKWADKKIWMKMASFDKTCMFFLIKASNVTKA